MTRKFEEKDFVLVGNLNWMELRDLIVQLLIRCQTEKEFIQVIVALLNATGSPSELKKIRKDRGIKPFSFEDLKKMKEKK